MLFARICEIRYIYGLILIDNLQEWNERENLRMSRPLDPIPMPYVDPKKKKDEAEDKDKVIPYEKGGSAEDMQGI